MNKTKYIFLIEDDVHDQFFFIRAIKGMENVVLQHVANDGVDALEKLGCIPVLPDLIFMDINMPRMNGLKCLIEIVNSPRLKQIPVVILSTSTSEVAETRLLGAKAYIKKPWNGEKLKEQVEQMINLDFTGYSSVANKTFTTALSGFSPS